MKWLTRQIALAFSLIERILRDRAAYFAGTHQKETLPQTLGALLPLTIAGFAIFGFVLGLSGGDWGQALASAVKLPFLFLVASFVCLPTLYYFNVLFGSRLLFLQAATLILTMQTVAAILVLGFTPISLLFWLSQASPVFLVTLNTFVLVLAAGLGVVFLVQGVLYIQEFDAPAQVTAFMWLNMFVKGGLRSVTLIGWLIIYGLVAAQLAWTLRPFFGVPLYGSNFWDSLRNLMLQWLP